MRLARPNSQRKGAALVENAFVILILLMFIIGILVGGLGVFRYQQIATLAREGARYASVRGTESGSPYTSVGVYDNAIVPMAAGLDLSSLRYAVTPSTGKGATTIDPLSNPPGLPIGTTVVVEVWYDWLPEAFFGGATLYSRAEMPMQY